MIVKDDSGQLRTGATNAGKIRKAALIFILIFVLSYVFFSCDKETVGPVLPQQTGFEWTSASPEEYGFDPALLDNLTGRIRSGDFGRITSVIIVRNKYLIYEEYFRGIDQDDLVKIYSCTKSIASALAGIAVSEGSIPDVNARLFDYLHGYVLFPSNRSDSLFRESLTLHHLLTMKAGFSWDELGAPYGHPENSYTQMINSNDWLQFTLNRQITSEPGTSFEYNTGLSGLMAVVLENSTGKRIDTFAEEKLFRHIGIDTCNWRLSPTGVPMSGSGLRLRPRDMAKFGWLYSQNGVWDDDTIVPSWWVQASHQPYSTFSDGRAYGYQWWLAPVTDDQGNPLFMPYALGYGGQHIIVPPIHDIVIVVTADDDQDVSGSYIIEVINLIGQAFTP
jgi:CubicO group peptidase (beta-lactamase class C family)